MVALTIGMATYNDYDGVYVTWKRSLKAGIKAKRLRCGWDHASLLNVLAG